MYENKPLKLEIEVYGSSHIIFEEGWLTGKMKKTGISIDHIPHTFNNGNTILVGGCIDREEAIKLYNFLGNCIIKWEENV